MSDENRYAPPQASVEDAPDVAAGELASRGARLGGAIIDGILSSLIIFPLVYWLGLWDRLTAQPAQVIVETQVLVFGCLVYVALHGYLLMHHGQTIGKRLVGTRIVSVDDNRILPFWKVFWLRTIPFTLVTLIPIIGNVLPLVNVLFIFRDDRRCLHDLLAGSKVVKA